MLDYQSFQSAKQLYKFWLFLEFWIIKVLLLSFYFLSAQILFISEHTLRNHLTSIYNKLEVANRLELFANAHKHGLSKLPE